jgi:hypothetical protein
MGISMLAAAALLSLPLMGCSAQEPSVDAAPPIEEDILMEDVEIAPEQEEEEQ